KGLMTRDTYGRIGDGSSISADLQSFLESRLRARMAAYGSPEYVLTWKHWDMPSGPPICALRARARKPKDGFLTKVVALNGSPSLSERRISGNGFGLLPKGWTTPQAHDASPRGRGQIERRMTDKSSGNACLACDAW